MSNVSDTEKVKKKIIEALYEIAPLYHSYFCKTKYLVYSPNFQNRPYYIIYSEDINFLHLTGLGTNHNPYDFYKRCINQNLNSNDFRISYYTNDGVHVKRKTIQSKFEVLPKIIDIFSNGNLIFEEDFKKGNFVSCKLATSEGSLTLGFALTSYYCIPMTLLKKNYIDETRGIKPTLILSGPKGATTKFDTIILGNENEIKKSINEIGTLISKDILEKIK